MKHFRLTSLAFALSAAALPALQNPFPLTENTWRNPEFVERFVGSYGFDMNQNPRITSEESELLRSIAPLMERNRRAAISQLQTAMTADSSAALDYTIGSLLLQDGDRAGALRSYETAIRKFPNFFRAYQNAGLAYVQGGEFEEALTYLTKALEIGGGNGAIYGLIGYAYLSTGRPSQALDSYRQALLFQPNSNDWKLGKLNALLETNQNTLAIAMLDEMITERPDLGDLWMMQANAFLGDQRLGDALTNLEYVNRLGQATAPSLMLLGDLYLGEGLTSEAATVYADAMATGELSNNRLLVMAENLANRGAATEADAFLASMDAVAFSEAEELTKLNLQARLALSQGEQERAAEILEQVIARDPLNGRALLTLGNYYRDQGDLERATFQYEAATRVPDVQLNALTALARLKVSQKQYRQAVELLRRAQAIENRSFVAEYIDRIEAAIRAGA